jgi:hypothetical protein
MYVLVGIAVFSFAAQRWLQHCYRRKIFFHQISNTDEHMLRSVTRVLGIKLNTDCIAEVKCLLRKFIFTGKNKPTVRAQKFFINNDLCKISNFPLKIQRASVALVKTHFARMTIFTLFSTQGCILLPTSIPARTYVQSLRHGET